MPTFDQRDGVHGMVQVEPLTHVRVNEAILGDTCDLLQSFSCSRDNCATELLHRGGICSTDNDAGVFRKRSNIEKRMPSFLVNDQFNTVRCEGASPVGSTLSVCDES